MEMFGLQVCWGYGRIGHPNVEVINPSAKALELLDPD